MSREFAFLDYALKGSWFFLFVCWGISIYLHVGMEGDQLFVRGSYFLLGLINAYPMATVVRKLVKWVCK